MRLATLHDGSRDGQLIVVSRDLRHAHVADGIAPTLQRALDDWRFLAPQLQALQDALDAGRARHAFEFDPARCMAPLPRAFGRVRASAWPVLGPLAQACSDRLLAGHEDIALPADVPGARLELGWGAITDAVPAGGAAAIRLLTLLADWRVDVPDNDPDADWHARPGSAFAPLAITPDEAGAAWRDGRLHAPLRVVEPGAPALEMHPARTAAAGLAQLVALSARMRPLGPGTLVTVGPLHATRALAPGERVHVEMHDAAGRSLFGALRPGWTEHELG